MNLIVLTNNTSIVVITCNIKILPRLKNNQLMLYFSSPWFVSQEPFFLLLQEWLVGHRPGSIIIFNELLYFAKAMQGK
jgi:hypothetical protein